MLARDFVLNFDPLCVWLCPSLILTFQNNVDSYILISSKSYVWSTLGITASNFDLGALAFWVPTFLTRARVFLGLQPPCTQGSCPTVDRCRVAADTSHTTTTTTTTTALFANSLHCPLLLPGQSHVRSCDAGHWHRGRGRRNFLVQDVSRQGAVRGPAHLRSGPAGLGALLPHLGLRGVVQHPHHLRKTQAPIVTFPLSLCGLDSDKISRRMRPRWSSSRRFCVVQTMKRATWH